MRLLLSLLVLLCAPAALAQPVVYGTITDAATGEVLPGANVYALDLQTETAADAAGRYALMLPKHGGSVRLRFAFIGYASEIRSAHVPGGADSVRVDVALRADAMGLDDVVVTGEAAPMVRSQTAVSMAPASAFAAPQPSGSAHPYGEGYAAISENGWKDVGISPLSTFAVDVDRASYANVRRFLTDGYLPPPDAVRVEELVNYFAYDTPDPAGPHPFEAQVETMPAPWAPDHHLARITLQARRVDTADLPPSNLVFLLDVSGSMNSPDKLPLLKSALRMLVAELRPVDRVGIVVYAGAAGLVLPPTPGSDKRSILEAIDRLSAGGSTAGGAGIELAYRVAEEHFLPEGTNRVLLATDGDFNVGVSDRGGLERLIETKRETGVYLTVLGFGTGNVQDAKMETLSGKGNGQYHYIDTALEARKALVGEMGGTLLTVADDVKVQVEFNPRHVQAYRLIGYENRLLADEDFEDDTVDAGEIGAGHTVTALYEIVPVGVDAPIVRERRYATSRPRPGARSDELAYVSLRYKTPGQRASVETGVPVRTGQRAGAETRFAAAVAAWGMLLRGSEHRGTADAALVRRLAQDGLAFDPGGYRSEFVRLVGVSESLMASRDALAQGSD